MNLDLDRDMVIDETSLDVECLRQPKLAYTYGKYLAECQRDHSEAVEAIKTIQAELIAKVHENPEKYLGVGKKATVQVVEAFYRGHKKYIKAKDNWVRAQFELAIAERAYQEVSLTRKKMLENLIQLHQSQYFAGPSTPRDLSMEWKKRQQQKEIDGGVAKKMKRSK